MTARVFGLGLVLALLSACGSDRPAAVVASASPPLVFSTPIVSCLPDGMSMIPKPFLPTARERMDYLKIYEQPAVIGLKHVLEAYANGRADTYARKQLVPYGVAIAKDGFIVLSIEKGIMGGKTMMLRFGRHADKIFNVWVYITSAGEPSLRGFEGVACSAAEQKWMAMRYAPFLALGDDRTLVGR